MFTTDSCGTPRWQRWAEGWIKLADGLVLILSLGFVRPSWSSEWIGWMVKSSLSITNVQEAHGA